MSAKKKTDREEVWMIEISPKERHISLPKRCHRERDGEHASCWYFHDEKISDIPPISFLIQIGNQPIVFYTPTKLIVCHPSQAVIQSAFHTGHLFLGLQELKGVDIPK